MASLVLCDGHEENGKVLFWKWVSALGQCGEPLMDEGVNRVMLHVVYWV